MAHLEDRQLLGFLGYMLGLTQSEGLIVGLRVILLGHTLV
jgi:hypothetical protein